MEISADGSRLFLVTAGGVRIISIPAATGTPDNVLLTAYSSYLASGGVTTLKVTMRDPAGNPVTGYTGTVQFSSSDQAAGLPANYTFTPSDAGSHTFQVSLTTAGDQTVMVTDLASPLLTRTTANIRVHDGSSNLLPIPGARDLIFDATRNVLYVTTATGLVERYSVTNDSLLSPLLVSHSLNGGDINVGDSALYVHDGLRNTTAAMVHRVDLATGQVSNLQYEMTSGEGTGWDLAIDANGVAHSTATRPGYGSVPLRQIDTATNVISNSGHSTVRHNTTIARDDNRSRLGFVESNTIITPFFTYSAASQAYVPDVALGRIANTSFLAINESVTRYAISDSQKVLEIRDANLALVKTLNAQYGGVAFKPGTNYLYAVNSDANFIYVYDGDDNWKITGAIPIGETLYDVAPLSNGTVMFSADGSRLFLVTPTGVRVFDTADSTPPTISDAPGAQVTTEDFSIGPLPFIVGDNATALEDLEIFLCSFFPAVIPTENLTLGGTGANRTITITPLPNTFGMQALIQVLVYDKSFNFREHTFRVDVLSSNDAPSFVKGPDVGVTTAFPQTFPNWAMTISAGPNEASQTVGFNVTSFTNAGLFLTPPAVAANGTLTFTPAFGAFGSSTVTLVAQDNGGTTNGGIAVSGPQTFTITVSQPSTLQVVSFHPTATGGVFHFSADVDPSTLNLYDVQGNVLGAADIEFRGNTGGVIKGSAVVDPGLRQITFVATSGKLPADNYTVTLRSAANGVRDALAVPLDGDGNAIAGGDFVYNFSVSVPAANAVTVSIPNFARGPQQGVNLPANGSSGIPLSFSNGAGITTATFELRYNPAQLNVTTATVAAGVPAGATVNLDTSTPGVALLTLNSPTPLLAGTTHFASLHADVPSTALYRSKQVLDIANISLNAGTILALDDDGVQVVAYFADVTGNGTYSAQDASLIARLAVGIDTGLEEFQLLDPAIVGDITSNGSFSATDTSLMLQAAVGIEVPEIPTPLPTVSLIHGGPDPKLSIPQNLVATAGGALVIPVDIDSIVNLTGNGLASADLVIYYDPIVFEITSATLGRLVAQRGWIISSRIDHLAGRIDLSLAGTRPLEGQFLGELVRLHATVKANAPAGNSAINLAATSRSRTTQLNEGFLTLIPAPTDAANDAIDGRVTILANETAPSVENTAMLIGEQLLITGSRGDDRILVGLTINGWLRVRIGNQILGNFAVPAGVAVDALTGNDFVYVAPFAPPALISANLSVHDQIFGEQNSRVLDDTNDLAGSNSFAQPNSVLHSEALLQLLTAWQAESEADEFSPRLRSVRRLV